jgi:hypothetical protein
VVATFCPRSASPRLCQRGRAFDECTLGGAGRSQTMQKSESRGLIQTIAGQVHLGPRDPCRLHATASWVCLLRSRIKLLSSSSSSSSSGPLHLEVRATCHTRLREAPHGDGRHLHARARRQVLKELHVSGSGRLSKTIRCPLPRFAFAMRPPTLWYVFQVFNYFQKFVDIPNLFPVFEHVKTGVKNSPR